MQALQNDVLQVLKKYISIVEETTATSRGGGNHDHGNGTTNNQTTMQVGVVRGNRSILHCDVKNIPSEQRDGEQITLLEMTVEIDPRQTAVLLRRGGRPAVSSR